TVQLGTYETRSTSRGCSGEPRSILKRWPPFALLPQAAPSATAGRNLRLRGTSPPIRGFRVSSNGCSESRHLSRADATGPLRSVASVLKISRLRSTTLDHCDDEPLPYSSCQFHHLYGVVCG